MRAKLYFVITLLAFFALAALPNGFAQGTLAQPSVRLVYFLPKDRPARPDRIEALRQLIKDAQEFYADEMQRHGYGRKTFRVETDRSGEPIVHRFNGRFNEHHYYQRITDFKVWEEFFQQVNDFQHVYYIAIDLSSEILNEGESCGLGGVSFLPSGGDRPSFFFGSVAVRHRDITPGEEVLGGSAIMPASGHCFYDTRGFLHPLRLITHELAHAFGLEHDFSNPDSAVGGRGFRFSECDTEWLSVSRFFNSKAVSENASGNIQLISAPTYSAEGITLRFEVTDADGLHQAQLLVPEDGSWGPWKLIGCQELDGQTQRVEFLSSELTSAPERVMLQFMDDLGNITWATFLVDIASLLPPPKVVSIPDPNLKQAIRSQLGLASGDTLTDRAMKKLGSLNVDDRKITNIAGLEYATQLRELFIGRNQIKNYDRLAELPNLTTLYLWSNGINDLSVLPPMPQLEFLDLNWNQISDLSPLAEFTSLKELWLQGNKLADTSTLFQLHSGTFPSDEEVEVVKERDKANRAYTLLTFQSLDLKVRINPNVTVYRSLNAVQNARQTVTATNELVEKTTPATNVLVEEAVHPPMYWINTKTGTLHRLVDTEVEDLVPRVRNATSLAVDVAGGKLYWTEKTSNRTGGIQRANLDGADVQLVKNLTSVPHGIVLDTAGGKIYLTNSWGKVQRLSVNGSNFQPNLITGLEAPRGLALDISGGKVYWIEMAGRIRRANLDGSNIQDVATGLGSPMNLVVFGGTVYWTEKIGEKQGEIRFVNLNGTPNVVTRSTFSQGFPVGIAVDAVENKLYWTTSRGKIGRGNIDESSIQPDFATGLNAPGVLALSVETKVDIETPEILTTDAVISLSPSPITSPAVGERLTLNLNISAGEAVVGYQVTLQFDATALRYVESSNGDYLPTGAFFVPPVVKKSSVELASSAVASVSKGDGTLAIITFEVLVAKASTLTLSEVLLADRQGNTFRPGFEGGEITEPPKLKGDVNNDGMVNIQDLVLVAPNFGKTGQSPADINGDGIVNIGDLVLVAGALGNTAAAPAVYVESLEQFTAEEVRQWLAEARLSGENSLAYRRGILMLEQLLIALIPKETALLPNYPNPFNPETWIPYQLSEAADVTLNIYSTTGTLIRTFELGYQPAGIYQSRSRAAYWDGRNALGEKVASGIYFSTLSADDFTATRKMLIRK